MKKLLPYLAAGVAGLVATPAAAVAVASIDWSSVALLRGLTLGRRQALLNRVARVVERLGLASLGCDLRRHASYLPYDEAARRHLAHIPPGELDAILAELGARTARPAAQG